MVNYIMQSFQYIYKYISSINPTLWGTILTLVGYIWNNEPRQIILFYH